jgi:GAF domain-containing protein
MGIHDILHATRLIQSVQIFHWGFVAVALGLNYLLVRRFTRLAQNLESEVATRTRELESRGDQLAALVQSGHSLMGGLPLQAILERIMREASRIAKTPHILVFLMDREASVLRLAASSERLVAPGLEAPLGTSLSGRVATTGRPLFVPDTRNDPRSLLTEQNREAGIVTYLGLPITLREQALGVLVFNTEAPREYAPEEISYLSAFADQAALAIESARLYEALETRVQRTETLTRLNRLISSSLDVDHVLREIAGAATQVTGAALAIVWAADENRRVVEARAGSDEKLLAEHPNPSLRFGEGIAGWVAENRQPLAVADLGPDQRSVSRRWFLEHGFKSGMAVPIVHGESLLGVLSLVGREKFRLSPEDEALLGSLVDQAAIAVNNGKLYQALEARLDRVRTLTRLNQMISRSLDRDRVLGEIASAAAQVMAAPVVSFWMADEAARKLALVGFSDPAAEEDWPHQTLTFDEGVIGWVASHRLRLSVANAFEDGRFMALAWWRAHGLSSFLGVPVVIDGALVAVIALNGREPFRLGPDDETLLESFVAQATVAIRNALLYAAEAAARRAAERTLAEVKQLQGLLPICAYCKKIRNDKNYWEQLESYIGERSGAQFSHGICPECSATVVARQLEEWRRTR